MKIAEIYSHLNGLEFLLVHRKQLWEEVQSVINGIDAAACRTKVSNEKRMQGELKYSPKELNRNFSEALSRRGWGESRVSNWVTHDVKLIRHTITMPPAKQKAEIEAVGHVPILSHYQTDFVKDRVALEVQFGNYALVAYDLFVKHLSFYSQNEIDVGIEILAMKSLQQAMSSGPGYYEGELYNVIRNGRGVPGVPLVIICVAQ